jgi:D-lactate dehydrogenase
MKIAVFSTKTYDEEILNAANTGGHNEFEFFEMRLNHTSVKLANGFPAVCCFVNDQLDAAVLEQLHSGGTRLIALRCAGFNQVDLKAAEKLGITVVRVPAYSPHAVAEHAVGMMLTLNRKFHKAYNRVREGDFHLDGLLGFDMVGKTVGIVGTGKIGQGVAKIMLGFGCHVRAYDMVPNAELSAAGVKYVPLDELLMTSDIISLHCPLTPQTNHLINDTAFAAMKPGVMLINTSRGAIIDARAAITALKSGKLGYLGLDVYEEEADLFFEDLSNQVIQDDVFSRLLTFKNVLVTGHQAFFTRNALEQIALTTLANVAAFERGEKLVNRVC